MRIGRQIYNDNLQVLIVSLIKPSFEPKEMSATFEAHDIKEPLSSKQSA